MLTLRLLGPPEILIDGAPAKVTRRKSRALLYYLGVLDKPLRREKLLAFFWPDSPRSAAQQVLRATILDLLG
jgi:DNA-binding SARP family transcriptional activator